MCSSKADGYLKKPNCGYYDLFCDRVLKDDRRVILFVDDKVSNLSGALEATTGSRYHPVLFRNGEDLKKTFQKWKLIK